ncbi:hypothetical protein MKW98_020122 [Papaver atlanticum]|uniref:Uncharacterized protein n=1 Tax=Papaver atlanticum TaxID=357466 RepID=A0AAD4X7E4_9MAGN|nr:hypothetical protein MKW98_020122 [Papaver atlanticum]
MESGSRIKRQHVVAMPYPGRGHINPMMNEWLGFNESSESRLPPQIRLRSMPNVIPSELVRGLDFRDPFAQLLDQLQQDDDPTMVQVTTTIADATLPWAISVGNRRNIPVVSHWPMSPSVFSIFYHIDILAQNGHYPIDFSSGLPDELIDYIPGVSPIRVVDMPPSLDHSRQQALSRVLASVNAVRKAKCLLLTTYHELEPQVTKTLMEVLSVPVYHVGPAIPISAILEDDRDTTETHNNMNLENQHHYLKWLDSQLENTVLYVSFGSFMSASSEQMKEILAGLHDSVHTYNSVVDQVDVENELANIRSLVVPWCDQLRVLCHSSVGGFWTHCGWNSTLEGVYAGVPMLTFLVNLDQRTNTKLIVDDWKIGMKVAKEVGANILVKREEITMTVKKFMNSDVENEESIKMRTTTNEFKKICRQALAHGGSSAINLDDFIKNILFI